MANQPGELRVGIIMGSYSDRNIMSHAGRALDTLGLVRKKDYETRVVSAHRTPKWMVEYAETAKPRGLHVIIAGAGGSAHLPGDVASLTTLPVFGVAITSNPDVMNRALGSMIGMPEGKPLATLQDKAGAFNAGLIAARVLAIHDPVIETAYQAYDARMETEVYAIDELMDEVGMDDFPADFAEQAIYKEMFNRQVELVAAGIRHTA